MILEVSDVGSGHVVVLIHGFPLDRSMWRAQQAGLAPRFRVITPNLRGIGNSPTSEGVFTIDELADDIIETLDSLSITYPVVIGGLSMGGYVALSLAIRYPSRVRGLLLINTRAIADTPATAANRETMAQALESGKGVTVTIDGMLPKLFAPDASGPIVGGVRELALGLNPRGLASMIRGLAVRPSRVDDLPNISVPTLVIASTEDQIVPLDEARSMSESIPRGRLVVISKAGHLAPMEEPAAVNAAIVEFLEYDLRSV